MTRRSAPAAAAADSRSSDVRKTDATQKGSEVTIDIADLRAIRNKLGLQNQHPDKMLDAMLDEVDKNGVCLLFRLVICSPTFHSACE